jgi:hypothetical protein
LPNQHGVISSELEAAMVFEPVLAAPGDMVMATDDHCATCPLMATDGH